ncbi:MAG TPA: HlyD family secretion protein [Hyphomicrobiaceae bacterium]|nr:HlyD family secretion protein [Hyphomicrobiaceae bacterium]
MNSQPSSDAFEQALPVHHRVAKMRLSPLMWRKLLMIGVPVLVAVASFYLWYGGGRYVSTDNAYIHAPKLMVSSDVSGLVTDVLVHEGQTVRKGDVLFHIDPEQFEIAVDNAKAQLAQIALNLDSMKQDYQRMLSDAAAQAAQVELAQRTFDRADDLSRKGIASAQALDQARAALDAARKQQQSLREQAKVLLAKMGGDPDFSVTSHPSYLQAKAQLDEMQRQLEHSVIRAPMNGVVTQVDQLQPGVYLVAQTAALTNTGALGLVSTDKAWIDANFKETDLTWVKPGDEVDISIDSYPGRTWKGRVKAIAPASGAEFSVLPAQNASGNWVKVVQRIPVRITVERHDGDPPLRAGMSTYVTIDTKHHRTLADLW